MPVRLAIDIERRSFAEELSGKARLNIVIPMRRQIMQCQNCKAQLPDTAKFCNKCGAKVDVKLCPNGHVLEPAESACRYCPPAIDPSTNKVSLSTTIDNLAAAEKPSGKTTVVEGILPGDFGKTTITPAMAVNQNESMKLHGWLVVTEGQEPWKDYRITRNRMAIGRTPDCDIVIADALVSAKHASLRIQDNEVYLTDLDSSNGTFVNSQVITRSKLSNDDVITIGNTSLKFKLF